MPHVVLNDIALCYSTAQKETIALENITLELDDGEPIALIGPSGCGKTSILNIIAGLLIPTSGNVSIGGESIIEPRQQTALILQDYGLLPWKTVLDNVSLGLSIRREHKDVTHDRAYEALDKVGLSEFAPAYPHELSGGMRQRIALARALTLRCDTMLMDEPLSALDALSREEMQGTLLDIWREQGYAQILVTHSIDEAVFLGSRIVLMTPRPGRIAEIIDNPGMGTRDYRTTPEYFNRCAMVRDALVREGALSL